MQQYIHNTEVYEDKYQKIFIDIWLADGEIDGDLGGWVDMFGKIN